METIQGVRTKLIVVSYSHGTIRVPLAQSFNYTPRLTERTINEFDNLEAAQIVTSFDGVDITFDYLDSDSKLVEAMFADVDPDSDAIVDDPTSYKKVYVFANMKGLESTKIFASVLAKGCRTKGAPYTEPVKEEAKVTRDLSGTNVLKIKGAAVQYERILAHTPDVSVYEQVIPPNAYADLNFPDSPGPYEITHAEDALSTNGKYYLVVLKNGSEVITGFTATATKFTVADAPAATDVWEVYTAYLDV
jgi:hypothetical protein